MTRRSTAACPTIAGPVDTAQPRHNRGFRPTRWIKHRIGFWSLPDTPAVLERCTRANAAGISPRLALRELLPPRRAAELAHATIVLATTECRAARGALGKPWPGAPACV